MHDRWQEPSDRQRIVFFESQKVFGQEGLDESKTRLRWVDLSFSKGYFLVRAHLQPQTVTHADGTSVEITQETRSYFLYNPNLDDVTLRVVPLDRTAQTVHLANLLLRPKITAENVVDYVKFFGLLIYNPPFMFFSSLDEIPWETAPTPNEKARLVAALRPFCACNEDGQIGVEVEAHAHGPLKWFTFSIPVIFQPADEGAQCFVARMRAGANGHVTMDDDRNLNVSEDVQQIISNTRDLEAYHEIKMSAGLRRRLWWLAFRRRIALFAGTSMSLFYTLSSIIFLLTALGMAAEAVGAAIGGRDVRFVTDIFEWSPLLSYLVLVVTIYLTVYSMLVQVLVEVSFYVSSRTPGDLTIIADRFNKQIRQLAGGRKVLWLLLIIAGRVVEFAMTWAIIFTLLHGVGFALFATEEWPALWESLIYVFNTGPIFGIEIISSLSPPVAEHLTQGGRYLHAAMSVSFWLLFSVWLDRLRKAAFKKEGGAAFG